MLSLDPKKPVVIGVIIVLIIALIIYFKKDLPTLASIKNPFKSSEPMQDELDSRIDAFYELQDKANEMIQSGHA